MEVLAKQRHQSSAARKLVFGVYDYFALHLPVLLQHVRIGKVTMALQLDKRVLFFSANETCRFLALLIFDERTNKSSIALVLLFGNCL